MKKRVAKKKEKKAREIFRTRALRNWRRANMRGGWERGNRLSVTLQLHSVYTIRAVFFLFFLLRMEWENRALWSTIIGGV